ncbi:MAG: putative DNA binding domain-containing protein [Gemmatimonadaceae bacterium]|nr:putative DNA binding domain-containing protein [Gemmatimonadaceae bacterium]
MSESQNIEWKETWRDEYLKWICGFANAQGGVLEIGRNNRGEVVGVKDVLRLLEEIPNKAQSLLGIVVDVNLKSKDGREYLEVAVDPYPNPISYKGEFHYRSCSTKQVLRGAALSRFLLQKYGRTWDDVPLPGVGLKDLDGRVLQGFRQRGAESQRLPQDILEESDEGVIERLQLREAGFLKRAAVLLFHPRPDRFVMEAYVKIGCFRGSELLYQDVVEGDLFTQVDRTMDLLYSKYTRALISYDGVYRVETFPVPREAMREAVINAVIHRDYASPTTIQIRVYDDRIAVWNAVQLPPEWVADPLAGDLSSKPYNPRIAYAFFRAGTIEAWGRGIRRIVDMCREAGNPTPEWRVDSSGDGLWLRFPFSASYRAADSEAGTATTPRTTRAGVVGEVEAADQPESQPESAESQPESQPESSESQPESLALRVLKELADGPMSKTELSSSLGQKKISGQLNKVIRLLVADERIAYTIPDKPRSRLQQYRLTDKGRTAVAALEPGSSRT